MEKEYLNGDGERVQWALESIETVDWIGPQWEDGREVYHEFSDEIPRDQIVWPLTPETSTPGVSGV